MNFRLIIPFVGVVSASFQFASAAWTETIRSSTPERPLFEFVRLGDRIVASELRVPGEPAIEVGPPNTVGIWGIDKSAAASWSTNLPAAIVSNANYDAGFRSKVLVLAHDDIAPLGAEFVDSSTNTILKSFTKEAETINAGAVRVSVWTTHDYAFPALQSPPLQLRIRFAANCTAKIYRFFEVKGMASTAVDATASGTGNSTTATTTATSLTSADKELLLGVVGIEGPQPAVGAEGWWNNSFIRAGPHGTTGGGSASNITLYVGWRTISIASNVSASAYGLSNSKWAALVAAFRAQ